VGELIGSTAFKERLLHSNEGLFYFDCDFCNEKTPTWLDFPNKVFYTATCAVCCRARRLRRFILHQKCKMHVECVGFITNNKFFINFT
jgi:hypothetical protein